MTKKVLAVDIDDVLADSTEALRVRVNKFLSVNIEKQHYKVDGPYWHYYEHVWENQGIADKVSHEALEADMEHGQSHVLPVTNAINALAELAKHYDIIMVTSRNQAWAKATEAWLHTHFGKSYKALHILGNHKNTDKPRTKGEVCQEIGASWLIDDNPEHCLSAIAHGTEAILFGEYGWHFDAPEHLVRCKDWSAVLEYFNAKT